MSLQKKGYVALLKEPLNRAALEAMILVWLTRFDMVEQLKSDKKISAFAVRAPKDAVWERDLQFRVTSGEQFSWVYMTAERRIIEADGLTDPSGPALSLDVLAELPGLERVVSDRDDKVLDAWEAEGLM